MKVKKIGQYPRNISHNALGEAVTSSPILKRKWLLKMLLKKLYNIAISSEYEKKFIDILFLIIPHLLLKPNN